MDPTQDEEFAALGIKNTRQAKQAYWAISCLKRSQRWKLSRYQVDTHGAAISTEPHQPVGAPR